MNSSTPPNNPLTCNIRSDREPLDLKAYRDAGGYEAAVQALKHMSPQDVVDAVSASNLRGRGGAGFPTGKKWSFVPMGEDAPKQKYLLVNADEMEPGTFKDRLLLEGNPHQMVEAVICSAVAIQARTAYIFLRKQYTVAEKRLHRAIAEARDAGFLGKNILDAGFDLDIHVHSSAGRYMAGEETGLISALEGKRAIPRHKPPYPQVSGLWGKPTVVNNVETLCNVPHIINYGAEWFKGLSHSDDGGTKLYGASGNVNRPGAWELAMGTPVREILEEHAGGMRQGFGFRGFLPGGASTPLLTSEHIDLPMDYGSTEEAGSRLGTGTMIIFDDQTCIVGMCKNLEHFFAQESCGWCTPCRDGLPWTERLLAAIDDGQGKEGDLEVLDMHCNFLGSGMTFCAHAPGAVMPLQAALKHFRADFERHIKEGACPWRTVRKAAA